MKPPRYQRLTRASMGLVSYSSLWLAPDHVLLVEATGVHEAYQRFYLRDIQAILISESEKYFYFNLIAVVLLGIAGIPVTLALTGTGVSLGWGYGLIPGAVLLGLNLWAGPSCKVQFVTGRQGKPCPPLSRRRRARRVLRRLEPLIREAQASLTGDSSRADAPEQLGTLAPDTAA
jgi:hypothetical protein